MATNFQISLANATWIDANTLFTQDTLPDLLPNDLAVANSLTNLFGCPIGSRSRIFEPEYGSLWYHYLQEPIDAITASTLQMVMIQAINRWEPRITLDFNRTFVRPNYSLPGYQVQIAGTLLSTGAPIALRFNEIP